MDFLGIFLNKLDNDPLYYQLYIELREQIRSGKLAAGERLPGKRTAAGQLGVSVNTVEGAYQMLAAEGYVVARPRSGFVVNQLAQLVPAPQPTAPRHHPQPPAAGGLWSHGAGAGWRYSFASSGIDTSFFPRKTWNRLQREVLADVPTLFEQGEGMGDALLRESVALYLQGFRGVRCQPEQIVVGAGLETLTGMLARLYADRTVAVENPGYLKTTHILQNVGVAVRPVGSDGEGMRPDLLEQSGARIAYLTPSHQFPTGAVMPVGRRSALLRWAQQGGRLIIEDDYDSEFRFDGRPLPSLQGLGDGQHVIYAGTFTRSLAPGLRVAYLVLPFPVLRRWQDAYGEYSCTVSRPDQQTLARLMQGGHFSRSLNRARAGYKKRRGLLLEQLAANLAREYRVENIHTGLYFVLRLPGLDAAAIASAARDRGIRLRALDEYRRFPQEETALSDTRDALVIGYGGLADKEIPGAAAALADVIDAAVQHTM